MAVADEQNTAVSAFEPERYPWHDSHWENLTRDLARLPHALLLHGQSGAGKNAFALRLARLLLCRRPAEPGQVCGDCQSCRLFRAGNHPDLLRIGPLEDSSNILVDQVRGVIDFLSLKAHMAAHKVVVISPAEAMNVSAANSLLKILEEPPAGSVLILVATHLTRVSATIRSRCRRMPMGVPPASEALAWLQSRKLGEAQARTLLGFSGGAPLTALEFAQSDYGDVQTRLVGDLTGLAQRRSDPVTCAERWKVAGVEVCLDWLHRYLIDLVRTQPDLMASDRMTASLNGGKSFSLSIIALFNFIDKVSIARRQLGTGVDETLMLEDLLIRWCEMTATNG